MTEAPRVAFRVSNRRGLGHAMRASNIAREILALRPDARIFLHARAPIPAGVCDPRVRVEVDPGDRPNEVAWGEFVREVRASVVVYDTILPADPRADPESLLARRVFVMRRCREERHRRILAHPLLARTDAVVVPHDREEFGYDLPHEVLAKTEFVGPIVRRARAGARPRLRAAYGVPTGARWVVSTVGGGGFADQAAEFFETAFRAHEIARAVVPSLRHLAVAGPRLERDLTPPEGVDVVREEPDMAGLIAAADVVISAGGYNTVHEIRLAKVPAVFVPAARTHDDQEVRVLRLAARGLARVVRPGVNGSTAREVAAVLSSSATLEAMARDYRSDGFRRGNRRAAEIVLGTAR